MVAKKTNDMTNVISYAERVSKKNSEQELEDIVSLLKNHIYKVGLENADVSTQNEIQRLQTEVDVLNNKLSNSFPTKLVILLCCYLSVSIISIGLFVFQSISSFKVIDYYILLIVACGSIGLFATAISTIIEFRKKINVQKK